jgi:hypothetical protein
MNGQKNIAAFLAAATAVMIAMPPVSAQQKTIDGDDDEWFMEETTPKDKQPAKPVKIPDNQAANLGVPMTEDGRIIPMKDDNTPVMPQQSQIQVTNEYVIQPGAYYPGMPQMNMPYGGVAPYYAPGVMPYRPGINIGLGRAGNINIGGNGYANPYGYGYPGYGTGIGGYPYGYGTGYAPGYMGGIGGIGGFNRMNGIGFPGMGVPNMINPGFGVPGIVPGVNAPAAFR